MGLFLRGTEAREGRREGTERGKGIAAVNVSRIEHCVTGSVGPGGDGDGAERGCAVQRRLREHPVQSVRVSRAAADPCLAQRLPRQRAGHGIGN